MLWLAGNHHADLFLWPRVTIWPFLSANKETSVMSPPFGFPRAGETGERLWKIFTSQPTPLTSGLH